MNEFYDQYWKQCFDALEALSFNEARIVGPAEFCQPFPNYFIYEYKELMPHPEYFVIHKGMIEALGSEYIIKAINNLNPVFANEVFVIYGTSEVPSEHFSAHLASFTEDLNKHTVRITSNHTPRNLYTLLRSGEYAELEKLKREFWEDLPRSKRMLVEFHFNAKDWGRLYSLTYAANDIDFNTQLMHAFACVHIGFKDGLYYDFLNLIQRYEPSYNSEALRLFELAGIDDAVLSVVKSSKTLNSFFEKHFLPGQKFSVAQVSSSTVQKDQPIDAVYTWFDPSDNEWAKLRDLHTHILDNELSGQARFSNIGEIYTSINNLVKNMDFLQFIYIVSAGQNERFRAELLTDVARKKIRFISHKEICFPDVALPTFNSDAIESCLHKIPDLSSTFVYMNDDCFLAAKVTKDDLFDKNGKPRLLANRRLWRKEDIRVRGDAVGDRDSRTLLCFLDRFGSPPAFVPAHQMMILTKKAFERTWEIYEREIQSYITSYRMRDYVSLKFILLAAWVAERENLQTLSFIAPQRELNRVGISNDTVAAARNEMVFFFCLNNLNYECQHLFSQFTEALNQRVPAQQSNVPAWLA